MLARFTLDAWTGGVLWVVNEIVELSSPGLDTKGLAFHFSVSVSLWLWAAQRGYKLSRRCGLPFSGRGVIHEILAANPHRGGRGAHRATEGNLGRAPRKHPQTHSRQGIILCLCRCFPCWTVSFCVIIAQFVTGLGVQ